MYGHSFADLLAIANIGVLVNVPGTQKFESAARVLRDRPARSGFASKPKGLGRACGAWCNHSG